METVVIEARPELTSRDEDLLNFTQDGYFPARLVRKMYPGLKSISVTKISGLLLSASEARGIPVITKTSLLPNGGTGTIRTFRGDLFSNLLDFPEFRKVLQGG